MGKGSPEVRFRARPAARKRWERAASERGETLSAFLRRAADEPASRQPEPGGDISIALATHTLRARARATLEERIQATLELVDGLGSGG